MNEEGSRDIPAAHHHHHHHLPLTLLEAEVLPRGRKIKSRTLVGAGKHTRMDAIIVKAHYQDLTLDLAVRAQREKYRRRKEHDEALHLQAQSPHHHLTLTVVLVRAECAVCLSNCV